MLLRTNLSQFSPMRGIQLLSHSSSFAVDAECSEKRYVLPTSSLRLTSASCSPPTPVSDLNDFRNNIESLGQALARLGNGLSSKSLMMRDFAHAENDLARYVNSLPDEFCVGDLNRSAFEALNQALLDAKSENERGVSIFENNLQTFSNNVTPLLNAVYSQCERIDSTSRDFIGVTEAVSRYEGFISNYTIEVWNLSPRIEGLWESFQSELSMVKQSLQLTEEQIQLNAETEAQTFVTQQNLAEAAFVEWEKVNGKSGYDKYFEVVRHMTQKLIPNFNAFLQRIPQTTRVEKAVELAQKAIDQIDIGFRSFPTFLPLPSDSDQLPHLRYGRSVRKFGEARIIAVLQSACVSHYNDTKRKLYIGDMQYLHGGRVSPHVSHKEGIDADVDPVEIGNVPKHDEVLALAAGKRFLGAGAKLIFFADSSVVDDANAWASKNKIEGRISVEKQHTNHFHLRV